MTAIPVSHRDVLETAQVVALATLGPDGFPTARQKTKNLQRRPEATLFFVDPTTPYRTLEVRARAEVAPDPDYAFADRISARYGGADLRANDRPGDERVVVTFTPVKVNTFGDAAAAAEGDG